MPPNETAPANVPPPPRSRTETIVLVAIFVGTLGIALGYVTATVGWGLGFPAVVVAILLSMAVATLAYAFLGGVAGTEFTIGAAKLAGSAALIGIVYWLIADHLEKNMNDVRAIEIGQNALAQEKKDSDDIIHLQSQNSDLTRRVGELESGASIKESDTVAATLARIRESTPADSLGRGVIQIYRNRQGPFQLKTETFKARFLSAVPKGTFWFCHDSRPDLSGNEIQFEVIDRENQTSKKIRLRAGSDIGLAVCQGIQFDVQLGCDAATELFGLECTTQRGVAWPQGSTVRIFDVPSTVLSSDFGDTP